MLVTIISVVLGWCIISTRVGVVGISSSTKLDPGITGFAFVFVVKEDTDSGFGRATHNIKSFLVTGCFLEPISDFHVSRVLPIRDQRVQGVRLLVDDNKLDLLTDLHTEADLGEGCVPVGGKFSFPVIQAQSSLRQG